MKSKEEIRNEIEAARRTIENHRNAFNEGKITRDSFKSALIDNEATIAALRWVLGENDRYD